MKRLWLLLSMLALLLGIGTAAAQNNAPRITEFSTSVTSLNRSDLSGRRVLVAVTWNTANRPQNSNLVFEQILPDGRVMNIELPRTVAIVPNSGTGSVLPFPPGNDVNEVRLRLSLIDLASLRILDSRELVIPIGSTTATAPTITSFTTTAQNVNRAELRNNAARLPVRWSVESRPDNSNLIFEQVLDNNQIVNVELPRSNPIVPSSGSGVVAPVAPSNNATTTITLRLRLVNLTTNATITQRDLTLTVTDAPAVSPVIRFTAAVTSVARPALVDRSARVSVSWDVQNRPANSQLVFEQQLDNGQFTNVELPRPNPFVPSSGNGTVAPVSVSGNSLTLRLRIVDGETQATLGQQTLNLNITGAVSAPSIRIFTSTATSVTRDALAAKTARIPVNFAVDNRPANSNLVFEQVLEDNTAVSVELPRTNPIIPSSGLGIAAPGANKNASTTSITLRLRVVDLTAGTTLAQATLTIPIADASSAPRIRVFSTTSSSVVRNALTDRSARIPVTWDVSGRPANSNLVFEQVLEDNRVVNVELPRTNPIVPSAGSGVVSPLAPVNASTSSITLQLRVVDLGSNSTLATQTITVPIVNDPNAPTIRTFSANPPTVDNAALLNRSARVSVSWDVANRPQNSNLLFEQVLDDGRVVNVELPRSNPFVASSGNGVVAPVPPAQGATATITLRLRLVNLVGNNTLAQTDITLNISGRPQPTSTPTPAPQPTAGASSPVQIAAFTVSPNPVARGGTVTIVWNVSGAVTRVRVGRLSEYGATFQEAVVDNQQAGGSITYTLPADYVNSATFQLSAFNAAGQETIQTAQVAVSCPFINRLQTGSCPVTQASDVNTAFQPFERGMMFWRGDTQTIYVLYNDGSWQTFEDTWSEGETTGGGNAPAGLIKPERGFGKVWFQLGGQGPLGWATAAETSYRARWETYQVVNSGQVTTAPTFTLPDNRVATLGVNWKVQ